MPRSLRRSPRSLWAYAYLIVPPQTKNRLKMIRAMVDDENSAALAGARIWTGRLVQERRITHILIVSDGPEQNRGINERLEAELKRLQAEFFLTEPMAIGGDPEGIAGPDASAGNRRHRSRE